jgi:hypothetical protein
MAYDEGLAERIRGILAEEPGVREKRMFGGLAFLLHGNMCAGVVNHDLMVRVGRDAYDQLLREPHVREMDFTGRPMRGLLFVGPEGVESDSSLEQWVGVGVTFAKALPRK